MHFIESTRGIKDNNKKKGITKPLTSKPADLNRNLFDAFNTDLGEIPE